MEISSPLLLKYQLPKAMRKGQLLADVFSFVGYLLHFPAMFPVIDPNRSSSESVSGDDMSHLKGKSVSVIRLESTWALDALVHHIK